MTLGLLTSLLHPYLVKIHHGKPPKRKPYTFSKQKHGWKLALLPGSKKGLNKSTWRFEASRD